MKSYLVVAVSLVGCATAAKDEITGRPDAGSGVDSSIATPIDASLIDAPPDQITMTQTTAQTVTTANSFGCVQNTGFTRSNSYYRVFKLIDHGITGTFNLTNVAFSVEEATANAGSQPVQVRVGTYAGATGGTSLVLASITNVNSMNVSVPNGTGTTVDVPLTGTFTASSNLIVEVAVPDGVAAQNVFFIGSNTAGESQPGYILGADCGVTTPTSMASIGVGLTPPAVAHILISVSGTH